MNSIFTSQVARFVRLFLFALAPALLLFVTGQSPLTIAAVTPAVSGALEVAWRGIHPTIAAGKLPPASSSTSTSAEPYRPV